MKLLSIEDFENNDKGVIKLNESINTDEIETSIDYARKNNLKVVIYIDDFSEIEIGKIAKLVGENIVYNY
ncbi:hypothetical protein KO506_02070 [Polaribacter vadi]|uniref:hypothetical protein n=1 Tax=Polaribacter TaxID=52959 RepID=UPI001C080771|nr:MULTISPECIES: hypothetical protein [Polaribacter]MBU3010179.1 hypothetical protein [Polaribacter vadi]MDO6739986.1 hypothetical protein [Polaribacter sp. 1_MG-2023]